MTGPEVGAADIRAMARAFAAEGFTPERVLAGRDTPLARAVAEAMREMEDGETPE